MNSQLTLHTTIAAKCFIFILFLEFFHNLVNFYIIEINQP
jgi:hypothetical protein